MPLTFNLLAPWGHAPERASSYLIELLPAFTGAAASSYSNIRPDVATQNIRATTRPLTRTDVHGRNGFVAFEIKFSESMREPVPELKPRHAGLSDASGLFADPAAATLRTNPLQQFWREHLLAQSMIDNGLYDEGFLVVIAPAPNYHVQDAAEAYQAQLREPEDGKVRFVNLTLEDVIEVIPLSDPAQTARSRDCRAPEGGGDMMTLQERVHGFAPPASWQIGKLHRVFRARKGVKNVGTREDNLLSLSYGRIIQKDIDTAEGLLPESFETYQIVEPGNVVMRLLVEDLAVGRLVVDPDRS